MKEFRKGVTPVVATVLLLFISVGLVGAASVFVGDTVEDVQDGLEERMQEEEEAEATSITVISTDLTNDKCTIRNTGGVTIEEDLWFIDGQKINGPGELDPNEKYTFSSCEEGMLEHPQGAAAVIG